MVTGMASVDDAWAELHDATPPGWYVGTPSYHVERRERAQYAFDTRERAHTAVGAGSGRPSRRPRRASCGRWRAAR
jgi:hypothetical protein